MAQLLYPDWREKVVYSAEGPQPQALVETDKFKVVVAGLEPGQKIPVHPEGVAMYHFLEGTGSMQVDEQTYAVKPGVTVITPAGAKRGMEAHTHLAFIAARVV